jgi:ABC-type branched-subunit amino acid transport system substrate-binding protein
MYGTPCPRDGVNVCFNDNIYSDTAYIRWFKEKLGVHKAAVFFYGLIAISADAGAFVQKGLELEGFDVTGYNVNFANPNFDQAVDEMKKNGTDMILDVIDDGTNQKLCATMERYGLRVKAKVSTVVSYGDEIGTNFSDVCRNSIYIAGNTMSYDDLNNPAVKEFRDAFDTYQPGVELHQWSLEGWMAGKSFVEAISSMGAAPTRVGLERWLNGLNKYTANGLSIPIDFKKVDYPHQPRARECTAIAQWQDSRKGWVQRTNPYDCFDGVFWYATKASDRGD